VAGISLLNGPAIQRPSLEGTHVAEISVGGNVALLQSFDDPLLVRGASRPRDVGHSFSRRDTAVIHVDVPISLHGPIAPIAIRVLDLSKLKKYPTDLPGMAGLLSATRRGVRTIATITSPQLADHPDWLAAGLPGDSAVPGLGYFEIYVDRRGKFRWRLRGPAGRILAESSHGYAKRTDCETALRWVKAHASTSPVRSLDIK
jgi:uncharacterized protein YegP (UPF0339 family)